MLCFEQWRANGQIVYEPLLWAIALVSHCTVHARPLDSICRHCARSLSPLGVFSRPGYCEVCDGWLGESDTDRKQARSGSATTEEQVWSSIQVEGLLAMLPSVDLVAARESFRRSLVAYLDEVTIGNVLALAQHIRCSHSILQNWLDGARVPRLETLLRTCRFLNVPASIYSLHRGRHRRTLSPQRNPSPSPAIGAYRHPGMRARSGKLFWWLLMSQHRAACRKWREVWATQIPRGSTKLTENSATGSLPDKGSPAEAIGGGSREQPEFAKLPG
jgi:hypothetical protein